METKSVASPRTQRLPDRGGSWWALRLEMFALQRGNLYWKGFSSDFQPRSKPGLLQANQLHCD